MPKINIIPSRKFIISGGEMGRGGRTGSSKVSPEKRVINRESSSEKSQFSPSDLQGDEFKATKKLNSKKELLKDLKKSAGTASDEGENRNIRSDIEKVKKQISEFKAKHHVALVNESKLKRDMDYHGGKIGQPRFDDLSKVGKIKSSSKDVKYQIGTAKDNVKLLNTILTKENFKKRASGAKQALMNKLPTIEPRKKEEPSTPFFERVKKDLHDVFHGGYSKRRGGDTEGGYGPNRG
jgi:hypothetical protein